MSSQGRCSARKALLIAITLLVSLALHFEAIQAADYIVGESSGWTFDVENWSKGKKFKSGDNLIFNYDTSLHNVVVVDAKGYGSCTASSTAKTYSSGSDKVKLSKGMNYFICSLPGHCDMGVKVAVKAS
ncbi:Phytocyanin domain [Dillenia turbinata]|uniref:Basic blue protein n=1 Tax=Dillenia turbinata TaxID=194707 RepID=A0AAN8ZJV5_9MAGN